MDWMNEWHRISVDPVAGFYGIGGNIRFAIKEKPSRWHRFWTRVFLGWEWLELPKS